MLSSIRYTQHWHNLRFCKTTLQVVSSAKRFAKSFYFEIRKAQIMTVERIHLYIKFMKDDEGHLIVSFKER